jgi:hypothetical protein
MDAQKCNYIAKRIKSIEAEKEDYFLMWTKVEFRTVG